MVLTLKIRTYRYLTTHNCERIHTHTHMRLLWVANSTLHIIETRVFYLFVFFSSAIRFRVRSKSTKVGRVFVRRPRRGHVKTALNCWPNTHARYAHSAQPSRKDVCRPIVSVGPNGISIVTFDRQPLLTFALLLSVVLT